MTGFSLIQALQHLNLDPYPTKNFRGIVNHLQNLTRILKKSSDARICCLEDIFPKTKENEKFKNRFVATINIYKILTEIQVPQKITFLLRKLLFYILIKLNRCTSEDASSILHDFRILENCIFAYRKYSNWDHEELDEIMMEFQSKLISMVQLHNLDNSQEKIQLFNIIRIMILDLGKHPVYNATTVKYLNQQVRIYYQYVKTLEFATPVNEYVLENQMTYLYILNHLIGRNFINNNKEEGKEILIDLRNILNDVMDLNRMKKPETYLIQNIMRVIELYQLNTK